MEKNTLKAREAYVSPDTRICPVRTERTFLASATIPEFNETEEDW